MLSFKSYSIRFCLLPFISKAPIEKILVINIINAKALKLIDILVVCILTI